MKRLGRWVFNALAFLSLLCAVATVVLWVRGQRQVDVFSIKGRKQWEIRSERGMIEPGVVWKTTFKDVEWEWPMDAAIAGVAPGTVFQWPLSFHQDYPHPPLIPLNLGPWTASQADPWFENDDYVRPSDENVARISDKLKFKWEALKFTAQLPTSFKEEGAKDILYNVTMPGDIPQVVQRVNGTVTRERLIALPAWLVVLAASICPIFLLIDSRKRFLARRRLRANLCTACGYDVRATPLRCPECGKVPKNSRDKGFRGKTIAKRLTQRAFTALAGLSLLCLIATASLWVRSQYHTDVFCIERQNRWELRSERGFLEPGVMTEKRTGEALVFAWNFTISQKQESAMFAPGSAPTTRSSEVPLTFDPAPAVLPSTNIRMDWVSQKLRIEHLVLDPSPQSPPPFRVETLSDTNFAGDNSNLLSPTTDPPLLDTTERFLPLPAWLFAVATSLLPGLWLWRRAQELKPANRRNESLCTLRLGPSRHPAALPGVWYSFHSFWRWRNDMKNIASCLAAITLVLVFAHPAVAADAVTIHEEQVVIPTYLIGPPDPNPQFYSGGNSQGAQHRIYPYPVYDNLTTQKVDKTYTMVYLENEYLKIGILPEIGGKVFEAIDKTNGYNFIYRQHVIKPALISLLGAWISGGIEWDVPHHHRATSFLPVQYTTESNSDGSKTVWVGELELRDRMEWAVGLTLYPGKSYLEAKFRMINRTPLPNSMLCFSNVAVSVNDSYQVIFPPSTQHVTYHAKRDFTTWPIATTVFNRADFTAGVDVSWYKNHFNSNSMFAWNYQDDFFAGYDHSKNAGTMAIADHNFVPGKKFWTWGTGPQGKAQDTLLTDSDGPYIELMDGAYSDNQPDYSWMAPFETRMWNQYWYPFRDIDGVKNANTQAAVNLDVKDGKAHLGFFTTSAYPSAHVLLKLKDQTLLDETAAIGPDHSYVKEVSIPAGADEHDLRASISDGGKELVAYSPVKLVPEAMPAVVTSPPPPEQIKTNEELYLTGLRIDQFRTPAATPDPYWNEALKRDRADIRVNTALAINEIKGGKYTEAEAHLRTAIGRATAQYTTPKDGEPFYYLGLALKDEGKLDDAANQFSKAAWSQAWKSPAYFELAEIASARGDKDQTKDDLQRSLDANALNVRAIALQGLSDVTVVKSSQGASVFSRANAGILAGIDPLDADSDSPFTPARPSAKLESATDLMGAGQWDQAAIILAELTNTGPDGFATQAPALYDLAFCDLQRNQTVKADTDFKKAASATLDYAFPFQMEMIPVFEAAMKANPSDSHAPYLLGNLLYDWQPDRAIALWEKSVSLGADFPIVYRNLAMVYSKQNVPREKILATLEKGVSLGGDAMIFNQLDQIYEDMAVDPAKRLAMMESHQPLINRDDVIAREINLKIFAGKFDEAIDLLKSRFFRAWEGGGRFSLGDSWINANLLKGQLALSSGNAKEALTDFQSAANFPANLQDATGNTASRNGEIQYWIGCAQEKSGDTAAAQTAWKSATQTTATPQGFTGGGPRFRAAMGGLTAGVHVADSASYFQALAMQKLGQSDQAHAIFQHLSESGTTQPSDTSSLSLADRQRLADQSYVKGLGFLGLGDTKSAQTEFAGAIKLCPDHQAANAAIKQP